MIQLIIYDLHLLFTGDHLQFFVDYVPHYQWWSIEIRSIKLIFICISNLTISKPKSMVTYIFNEIIFTSINSKIWWDWIFICWKHWKNLCIDYTNKFINLIEDLWKTKYLKEINFSSIWPFEFKYALMSLGKKKHSKMTIWILRKMWKVLA